MNFEGKKEGRSKEGRKEGRKRSRKGRDKGKGINEGSSVKGKRKEGWRVIRQGEGDGIAGRSARHYTTMFMTEYAQISINK